MGLRKNHLIDNVDDSVARQVVETDDFRADIVRVALALLVRRVVPAHGSCVLTVGHFDPFRAHQILKGNCYAWYHVSP